MEGYRYCRADGGWMTPEEVRIKENMNPEPDNGELLRPLNMTTQQGAPQNTTGPQPQRQAALTDGGQPNASVLLPTCAFSSAMARRASCARKWRRSRRSRRKPRARNGSGVRDFYREHAEFVERILRIPAATAQRYCESRAARILERGVEAIDDPETVTIADLTETALDKSALLQAGTEPQALLAATTTSADRELLLAAMRKPVLVATPADSQQLLEGLENRDTDNQAAMREVASDNRIAFETVAIEMRETRASLAVLIERIDQATDRCECTTVAAARDRPGQRGPDHRLA